MVSPNRIGSAQVGGRVVYDTWCSNQNLHCCLLHPQPTQKLKSRRQAWIFYLYSSAMDFPIYSFVYGSSVFIVLPLAAITQTNKQQRKESNTKIMMIDYFIIFIFNSKICIDRRIYITLQYHYLLKTCLHCWLVGAFLLPTSSSSSPFFFN